MMRRTFILFSLALLLLSGCSTEMKLASSFVSQSKGARVAVYFPEEAIVKSERDSQYGSGLQILKSFNQDEFLDIMYGAYSKSLKDYGLDVYVPENPDDVQVDSLHWLVILSQVEIVEEVTQYEDHRYVDDQIYYYDFPLNTINVASWFEMDAGEWTPTLYFEHNLKDGFDSKVDYSFWTEQSNYLYKIDTLTLHDVYSYAVYLGKLYAGLTYDYMMNRYLIDKKPALKEKTCCPLRYDPYRKEITYDEDNNQFIELEGE